MGDCKGDGSVTTTIQCHMLPSLPVICCTVTSCVFVGRDHALHLCACPLCFVARRQPLAGSEAALMVERKGDNVHSVARPAVSTQGTPPFIAHEMARCAADRAVVG